MLNIISLFLFLAPNISFRRAAIKQLNTTKLANVKSQILQRMNLLQLELKPKRPKHSIGVNLFLRYMEWDYAMYKAVQEFGIPKEEAHLLVEKVSWEIFSSGTIYLFILSRLRSSNLQKRINWILNLMFLGLFTSPFKKTSFLSNDGIAFDILNCPVANYFKNQNVPELTRYAACNIDYYMAQTWGVTLKRSKTIAEGHPICDFHFNIVKLNHSRSTKNNIS